MEIFPNGQTGPNAPVANQQIGSVCDTAMIHPQWMGEVTVLGPACNLKSVQQDIVTKV